MFLHPLKGGANLNFFFNNNEFQLPLCAVMNFLENVHPNTWFFVSILMHFHALWRQFFLCFLLHEKNLERFWEYHRGSLGLRISDPLFPIREPTSFRAAWFLLHQQHYDYGTFSLVWLKQNVKSVLNGLKIFVHQFICSSNRLKIMAQKLKNVKNFVHFFYVFDEKGHTRPPKNFIWTSKKTYICRKLNFQSI